MSGKRNKFEISLVSGHWIFTGGDQSLIIQFFPRPLTQEDAHAIRAVAGSAGCREQTRTHSVLFGRGDTLHLMRTKIKKTR